MKLAISTPSLITILPILAFVPLAKELIEGSHIGGVNTLLRFIISAFSPSLNPLVLKSSWHGLQITIATALLSWILCIFFGTFLGLISSNTVWKAFGNYKYVGVIIRRILSLPRAIHEVIWGLLLLQVLGLTPWVAIISLVIPYSSLMARVIANQVDTIDNRELIAIKQVGAKAPSALITSLLPKLLPVLSSYYGYRLECSLRGATILGIFGLGGIGTELQLTIQSLQFNEMWTSLWMLAALMITLERYLNWLRNSKLSFIKQQRPLQKIIIIFISIISISLLWLHSLDINLYENINLHTVLLPKPIEIKNAFFELPLTKLTLETILITLLASGIAIGTPPLSLLLWPNNIAREILTYLWLFLRLIPVPLLVLLLLLFSTPSISIAALALGVNNIGVMGRFLKENINKNDDFFVALKDVGASTQISWLYGKLTPTSKIYLAFAAYRTDVILRETVVVGIAGGIGLGWQLKESLSSFDWSQVAVITASFAMITLIGEFISDRAQTYWIKRTTDDSLQVSTQT